MSSVFDGIPVPQPVADTLLAAITQKSAFVGSGAAGVELANGAQMGGHFFARSRWAEDTTRAEVIDGTASTPVDVSATQDIAPIIRRKRVRTCVDGIPASMGLLTQNPDEIAIAQSATYWQREIDEALIAVAKAHFDSSAGILKDTHRKVVGTASPSPIVPISYSAIVKAASMLGDNALDLAVIAMHGAQWADMMLEAGAKATFIPLGGVLVPMIGNLRVVVSDNVPTSGTGTNRLYTALLFKPNACYVAIQQQIKEFIAPKPEVPSVVVSESMHLAVGITGTKWNVTDTNPTNVQLAVAASYAKATSNDKAIGVIALVTNASS